MHYIEGEVHHQEWYYSRPLPLANILVAGSAQLHFPYFPPFCVSQWQAITCTLPHLVLTLAIFRPTSYYMNCIIIPSIILVSGGLPEMGGPSSYIPCNLP